MNTIVLREDILTLIAEGRDSEVEAWIPDSQRRRFLEQREDLAHRITYLVTTAETAFLRHSHLLEGDGGHGRFAREVQDLYTKEEVSMLLAHADGRELRSIAINLVRRQIREEG